jgi:hypothetical protein
VKGIYTLDICDERDNIKKTKQYTNKIHPWAKTRPNIFTEVKNVSNFFIPDTSWANPLVDESDNFTFEFNQGDILSGGTHVRNFSNSYWPEWEPSTPFHTIEENKLTATGRELQIKSATYFEGEKEIFGLITYVIFTHEEYPSEFLDHYIVSAVNIEPNFTLESNERMYVHFKLIGEW